MVINCLQFPCHIQLFLCIFKLDDEVLKENLFLQMLQVATSGNFLSGVKNVHTTLLVIRLILKINIKYINFENYNLNKEFTILYFK